MDQSGAGPARSLLELLGARPHEAKDLGASFVTLFAVVLTSSVLRPLRDEMGIRIGLGHLQWLFSATFVGMLVAVPLFGCAASRVARGRLVPGSYRLFLLALAGFYVLLRVPGTAAWAVPAFVVWTSVVNLFSTSLAWSSIADRFDAEQGRRLFGVMAAGASAGGLAGPALAAWLAPRLGPLALLPCAGASLTLAVLAVERLGPAGVAGKSPTLGGFDTGALGGRALDGIRLTLQSPYLFGLGLLVVGYSSVSTLLYFQQAAMVATRSSDSSERVALLASVDFVVNLTTIALQVLLAGRLMRRLGLCLTLGSVPCAVACGFLVIGWKPTLPVLLSVVILHRAGNYALLRPAREVLFTALDGAAKYKAKNFVDTVLYRGSDALAAWMAAGLAELGLGTSGMAATGAAIASVWMATAFSLGRMHDRRSGGARPVVP